VVVPVDNARDLEQVPQKMLRSLRVVFARNMDDVLAAALKPVTATVLQASAS
jgi:ATP-dependent Lon protease